MTRAIIHVPTEDYEVHAERCMEYIEERGYEFVGLVRGEWSNVKKIFDRDGASVAIVATEAYLDPHRKGRVEVVPRCTNERPEPPDSDTQPKSARNRRPRPV